MNPSGRSRARPRRHAAAGAVLAGATLLGAFAASASAAPRRAGQADEAGSPNEELAFAIPRVSPPGGRWGGVGLPQPLTPADASRIRRIFAIQNTPNGGPEADTLLAALDDHTLLGDILADRYLAPSARPTASALSDWLKRFGDQHDAPLITAALRGLSPKRAAAFPSAAAATALGDDLASSPTPEEEDPAASTGRAPAELDGAVRTLAEAGRADAALRLIGATRGISAIEGAVLRANVARALFADGRDREALLTARDAARRSGDRVGAASFVAGLAAWRLGRTRDAAALFETATRADLIAESVRAGAAFWAARAHLALGEVGGYRPWMLRASAFKRTFYGLLASRRLGLGGWTPDIDRVGDEQLGEADVEALAALPDGRRAFALLQVGEHARAEATLRHLWPTVSGDRALCRSIMLVAEAANLPDLASEIASILQEADGRPRDSARFPAPPLRPRGGFTTDPALVYALTRVESDFDPRAVSDAGAHGLMQLEPVTADYVIGATNQFAASPARLQNAAVNLDLGQRYVGYLAASPHVEGDLIRLLASYNAGPNRLADWAVPDAGTGDPLLFMEAIPVAETRDFVHRSLTYLWIYAARLGLPAPSLDALAADIWPSYAPEVALAGATVTVH